MQRQRSVSRKKALLALGLMAVGAEAKKLTNYQEANCREYDHSDGSCKVCSFMFFMNAEGRCTQVSDQCKKWRNDNGHCTECYGGYTLKNGACVIGSGPVVVDPPTNDNCEKYEYVNKATRERHGSWFLGCEKVCVKCKSKFYLDCDNKCQPNPANCKEANSDGTCKTCDQGYETNNSGKCVEVKTPIKHCAEYRYVDWHGKHYLNWFEGCTRICLRCEQGYKWDWEKKECICQESPIDCDSPISCESPTTPIGTPVRTPVQTPCESPIGTPVQTPCESPIGTPVRTPVETPCEQPVQTPCQTPIQTPVGTPCEQQPVETPCQTPVATPCETPVQTPCQTPVETPCETPVEETPCETPVEETPCETPVEETPCETPVEEEPCETPVEEEPCETPVEEEPCETPVEEDPCDETNGEAQGLRRHHENGQRAERRPSINLRAVSPIRNTNTNQGTQQRTGTVASPAKVDIRTRTVNHQAIKTVFENIRQRFDRKL